MPLLHHGRLAFLFVTAVGAAHGAEPAAGGKPPVEQPDKAGHPAVKVITNAIGLELARIPAGEFMMGNRDSVNDLAKAFKAYEGERIEKFADEEPLHKVKITKPFYFGVHEVTIGEFKKFVEGADYKTEAERDGTGGWGYNAKIAYFEGRKPEYSWRNPGFKQEWLSRKEGRKYRLPTEAEWEYACRAGTTTRFNNGDDPESLVKAAVLYDERTKKLFPQWSKYAVHGDDGYDFTAPVGSFQPNKFGLYDMHGNVWEWCSDWYGEDYYAKSPVENPPGPASGRVRVRRGGSWHSWPLYMRSSFRNWNTPQTRYVLVGFRVAMEDF